MFLTRPYLRFAAISLGVVLIGIYFLFGGAPGADRTIQLDFGMYPDVFDGCAVEIDGRIVGRLERDGPIARNAFAVAAGRHAVRVVHERYPGEPVEFEVSRASEQVRLTLELVERYDPRTRTSRTSIGAR